VTAEWTWPAKTDRWQKCPICEGKGVVHGPAWSSQCQVCRGQKVLDTWAGLPPKPLTNDEAAAEGTADPTRRDTP
jgi:hypothetical protein